MHFLIPFRTREHTLSLSHSHECNRFPDSGDVLIGYESFRLEGAGEFEVFEAGPISSLAPLTAHQSLRTNAPFSDSRCPRVESFDLVLDVLTEQRSLQLTLPA
jgi:hypothetical protein